MAKYFYEQVAKAREKIKNNPRTCEICGERETVHNVMLKWDNGKIMCDDCAFKYYSHEENNDAETKF